MSQQFKHLNTVYAKNRLNEMLTEVSKTKQPVVIEKRGKPVAIVLDFESYEKEQSSKQTKKDQNLLAELKRFHSRMKEKYPQGTGDSVEILREAREGRLQS